MLEFRGIVPKSHMLWIVREAATNNTACSVINAFDMLSTFGGCSLLHGMLYPSTFTFSFPKSTTSELETSIVHLSFEEVWDFSRQTSWNRQDHLKSDGR